MDFRIYSNLPRTGSLTNERVKFTLKKETRILGISGTAESKRRLIICVIYRGRLWLDGVITCVLEKGGDPLQKLSRLIVRCSQYRQLRAIILSLEEGVLEDEHDVIRLARKANLPVISLNLKPQMHSANRKNQSRNRPSIAGGISRYNVKLGGKRIPVLVCGDINYQMTEEILRLTCANNNSIPEAVRVANLIAKQASASFSSSSKA